MDPRAAFSHQHPPPFLSLFCLSPFLHYSHSFLHQQELGRACTVVRQGKRECRTITAAADKLCRKRSLEIRVFLSWCFQRALCCQPRSHTTDCCECEKVGAFLSVPLWLSVCSVSCANNESWQDWSTLAVRMGVALAGFLQTVESSRSVMFGALWISKDSKNAVTSG